MLGVLVSEAGRPAKHALGAPVRLTGISKTYGEAVAVEGVNLDIAAGEFLTLLGPSGSGKTTTLMMLAGFETPTSGEIFVGDRSVTAIPPSQRNIGMVFQSYALFPHMTVFENVAFPLRMRKKSASEQEAQVRQVLEIVDLAHLGGRYPRQLSGGQQQRVALARAVVFEPPVLLMDEPLSALDKYLRSHLQTEIKRIQRDLGVTVVYVTHDQDEAMTMSDRICVMHQGHIRQLGTPEELYERPVDQFVAGFLGESNMLDATIASASAGKATLAIGGAHATVPASGAAAGNLVKVSVRPEHIHLAGSSDGAGDWSPVRVVDVTYVGDHRRYVVALPDGSSLSVKQQIVGSEGRFGVGDEVQLRWPSHAMRVFSDGVSLS
jgi:putative spermidine/putrescine transport system ATP-binding protein